jgi:hypothetical protein
MSTGRSAPAAAAAAAATAAAAALLTAAAAAGLLLEPHVMKHSQVVKGQQKCQPNHAMAM